MTGLFLVFEGIDNCGKTSQAKLAEEYLSNEGYQVIRSREPGGTKEGEALRAILKDKNNVISPEGEVQLFCIARKAYQSQRVLPVINSGGVFISDRYKWSTEAYQGARGLDTELIKEWNDWATDGLLADLVILIDRDAKEAIEAKDISQRDRFEQSVEYMKKVRENYLQLADKHKYIKLVSYREGDLQGMFSEVKGHIDNLLS